MFIFTELLFEVSVLKYTVAYFLLIYYITL